MKTGGIHKIEKHDSIGISVFGYENKGKHSIYASKKCCEKRHVDLLLIGEECNRHYVPIKDLNVFMYDHTLHPGGKNICLYCLQALSTKEMLIFHIKGCFKIYGKKKDYNG